MRYALHIAWFGAAIAWAHLAVAQDSETLVKLDEALKVASSFEVGGDSGPLREIEQIVFRLPVDSELRAPIEQKLLDTLESATTADGKRFLCRQLRVIGTEKSVASLEKLLTDPDVSHTARFALGRLEVPSASEALLRALRKTSGELQAGIIDTLGNRKCKSARGDLAKLLTGSDQTVAKAAAIALGRFGDSESAATLQAARSGASGTLGIEIDNALLNIAEQLAADGKGNEAASIYQQFYTSGPTEQLKYAGLRGLVITRTDKAANLLVEAMQTEDVRLVRYAISLIGLAKGAQATKAFVSALDSLPADGKVLMLRALGARGDGTAAQAIGAAVKDEDQSVRIAALEALGRVGDASSVLALVQASASADGMERNVARASLKQLSHNGVDAKLLQLLDDGEAEIRVQAISALASRGATTAVDALLKTASDTDTSVRRAAIAALGTLGGKSDLVPMVKLATVVKQKEDQAALVEAMGKAFLRIQDKDVCAAPVLAELQRAPATATPTLLRLLGKTGATEALLRVRAALSDSDSAVMDAAVDALADWPDADASADLLDLMTSAQNQAHKERALEGYLRMASIAENPGEMYLQALKRVKGVGDKKAILEGLGLSSEAPEALDLTLGYLDDKALQAAAGIATMRIAYRLRSREEQRARSALKQVLAKVDHPDVQKRTREVLNELDKYDDHILQWVTVGPFQEKGKDGPAMYKLVLEPETNPNGVDWKPLTKGIGSWEINLEATYGGLDFCAAYLRTRVWSPSEQEVQLEMGSDDGIKTWLNGKLVFDQWTQSGAAPRQKLVKVKLAKEWNDLMLKVVDQQGGWVGACRIRKPDGTALEGLKIEAR